MSHFLSRPSCSTTCSPAPIRIWRKWECKSRAGQPRTIFDFDDTNTTRRTSLYTMTWRTRPSFLLFTSFFLRTFSSETVADLQYKRQIFGCHLFSVSISIHFYTRESIYTKQRINMYPQKSFFFQNRYIPICFFKYFKRITNSPAVRSGLAIQTSFHTW